MENGSPKLSVFTSAILVIVALLFDATGALLNLIPAIGQILSVINAGLAYLIIGVIFWLLGVNLLESRRIVRFFSGAIVEIIPLVNVLPGITLSVVLTLTSLKIASATGLNPNQAAARLARGYRRRNRAGRVVPNRPERTRTAETLSSGGQGTTHTIQGTQSSPVPANPVGEKVDRG